MRKIPKSACVLLSGGQDSTTCLAWAREVFDDLYALTIYYGQRHDKEIEAAKKVARLAGVKKHVIVEVPIDQLTTSDMLKGGGDIHEVDGLPSSFVPARNLIFSTLAASFMYPLGVSDLVIGVSQVDFSGYPDCRKATIVAMQETLRLGLDRQEFTIHAPLIDLTKAETVYMAIGIPGAWNMLACSWTCYYGGEAPCGECPACVLRAQGFDETGYPDPALR
jgi:7-cyano-7-deazaguanine synthase